MWPSWWNPLHQEGHGKVIGKNANAFKGPSNALKRFPNAFERVLVFSRLPFSSGKLYMLPILVYAEYSGVNCLLWPLRVVVWENRAGSKDGGRPNSIILWALDACLIWLWTVVIEQNLVLLFRRLTTPLCFGAAGAKMAPEIRPTSRRKNTNFPMVFANQFFYDTFMAIITLDDRFTDGVNQCFLSGECRKK